MQPKQKSRFPTALELAQSYACGRSNPLEVAKHALGKAAQVPSVFLSVTPERALREAAASTQRWQVRRFILDDAGRIRPRLNVFLDGRPVLDRIGMSDPVHLNAKIVVQQMAIDTEYE